MSLARSTAVAVPTRPRARRRPRASSIRAGNGTLHPYAEGGTGVLGGRAGLRTGNCETNFVLEGGPGLLIFMSQHVALDIGYRVHHISNGHQCSNQGFNSNMGVIGLSYFFR